MIANRDGAEQAAWHVLSSRSRIHVVLSPTRSQRVEPEQIGIWITAMRVPAPASVEAGAPTGIWSVLSKLRQSTEIMIGSPIAAIRT
jgi:hypothetical protein